MKQEIARGERSGTELVCVRQTCDSVGSTTRGARDEEGNRVVTSERISDPLEKALLEASQAENE